MLKRKLLVINLVFVFVMLAIAFAGVFLLMRSVDMTNRSTVNAADMRTTVQAMAATSKEEVFEIVENPSVNPQNFGFPAGYDLLLVDKSGRPIGNTGLGDDVVHAIRRLDLNNPDDTTCTVYNGVVIVSRQLNDTTLHAVDDSNSRLHVLRRNVVIYMAVLLVALLVIFVGSLVVEIQVIFPRLRKLKEAMDQVYNGNYEQTLRVPPVKRRDEITTLLVDFDMLRRKLRDATLAKEAADRERGIVVSGISHDLRTPLTVIKTHAKGLLDGVAKRVGKEQDYISTIYSTALDMENLVAKLADFTKVETHEITYSFVVRDICELIQTFVEKHYIAYSVRGLNLKCKLPRNKKLWVSIDKDQFNRVWQNLCDNSLKYKEKETANVLITAELVDDNVVVRVADDGPGIAEYEVDYIFESYYRGDASRTNPTDGSGLGLAIVKNCVTAHNGQIQAYNDNGLTIEIILPYRRKK